MRYLGILGIIVLAVLLTLSCSKKKEEVAQLEQEMLAESAGGDSAVDSVALTDTLGMENNQAMDARAIPEEIELEPLPEGPTGTGYTVQVAGCESRAYAQHLVEVYRDRGYDPYVTNKTVDGQLYYRVRVGQFESLQEARALKVELLDKYSIVAWVDLVTQ
ncbi:MAG: hypothetical protein DRP47_06440 [Candidatus Zixiibacteriota bacterium]|nr:MAG: hypothetical protein DRP47_06440 [candidate division Zixibacteria bacterium]